MCLVVYLFHVPVSIPHIFSLVAVLGKHLLSTSTITMDSIAGSRAFLLEGVRFSSLHFIIFLVAIFVVLFVGLTMSAGLEANKSFSESSLVSYWKFFYAAFLKPHHSSSDGGQQSALESFYETQVCV